MASRVIYTVVAVVGIAAASGAAWWHQKPKSGDAVVNAAASAQKAPNGAAAGKPPSVEVARVELAQLVDDTRAVGSLRSRRGVMLRPEISGRITRLNFTDGQRVRKGQVLVQFDDQLPQAQVQQSQAELSIAVANQKRNQELVAQSFISQRSLDESAANLQVAQAKLALAKATAARLKIIAPFDGIVGIRQVNVGDYLKDGADIVNIEDIDAIYVDFRLPERFQAKVRRGQTALLDIDALPGQAYTAQIQAIDPLIDANGRSVGIRGCIDNRALQLRPGMFARVNTVFGVRENASVIPEEALIPQGGKQFVIKLLDGLGQQTRTTQRVEVKVGLRSPGKVEILQGLAPGDTVVRTGQQRVQKDGTVVTVVELANAPAARPASGPASAASRSSASSAAGALTGTKPAAASGPNPCGTVISTAPASDSMPARSAELPEKQPAGPALRHPA
ncbi:membrane fusion protein (multidrug efflux system) [Polaromonas sp. CG_9.5]|uniref:efflux RND transporter periplasmic adaptor subunit n=1 Tax=Polaromonas sp. CG_9.5 TaxID=3071705 RepID=UPI002E042965|nr:membrane fusion protein (multidrug efflux system) [Polaromonas sp. CG_9.5]